MNLEEATIKALQGKLIKENIGTDKIKTDNQYVLSDNLIWDERIGDCAIGTGLAQLEGIKEAEDQSGENVDEDIKNYLEEHPTNLFVVQGQIPYIKVTLLGDTSGNPVKIDDLRIGI